MKIDIDRRKEHREIFSVAYEDGFQAEISYKAYRGMGITHFVDAMAEFIQDNEKLGKMKASRDVREQYPHPDEHSISPEHLGQVVDHLGFLKARVGRSSASHMPLYGLNEAVDLLLPYAQRELEDAGRSR